jgi:hypothetical protein
MDVVLANAKGELEGETLHVNCFFFAPAPALEKHGAALTSILQSITSEG